MCWPLRTAVLRQRNGVHVRLAVGGFHRHFALGPGVVNVDNAVHFTDNRLSL